MAMVLATPDDTVFDRIAATAVPLIAQTRRYDSGVSGPMHDHARGQLLRVRGASARVRTPGATTLLPPGQLMWLPGGLPHGIATEAEPEFQSLYLHPDQAAELPAETTVFRPSQMLAVLMERLIELTEGRGDPVTEPHLTALVLHELRSLSPEAQALALPRDGRLLRLCIELRERPGDRSSTADLARRIGASRRWLERHFLAETGLPLAEWRRQARVQRAIEMLGAGDSVQRVAWEVGYDSPSAFASMFRKVTGRSPREFT